MSYIYYPHINSILMAAYINKTFYIDIASSYIKVGGRYVTPKLIAVKTIRSDLGSNYYDLTVDADVEFDSGGGIVEEVRIMLYFKHLNTDWGFALCARPGISVGAGTATLSQRFITRFYATQ